MNLLIGTVKWIAGLVGGIVIFFLLNVGVHRLRGPSAAQDAALSVLAEVNARPARDNNAFPLFWLMRYDVADDQIEAIAAADVHRAQVLLASGERLDGLMPSDRPLLPEPSGDDPGLCETRGDPCLARVKANPDATRELLARFPRSLQRARLLEAKDSYRTELPITVETPVPRPGFAQRLRLSELALAWHDGARVEAIAGACRNVASWRRMRQGSDSLIFSMLAIAYMDSATRLVGDMLAVLPADESVPDECVAAFAPIVAEDVSLCTEMAGELLMNEDALRQIARAREAKPDSIGKHIVFGGGLPLLFSEQQSMAWRAQEIVSTDCSEETMQRALQDRIADNAQIKPGWLECASNAIGCVLHEVASPGHADYPKRLLDSAAHLHLAASLIWLRETAEDSRPVATRFAERPVHLRSGERASGISDDGKLLWVENQYYKRDARFSLALPSAAGMQ